MRGPFSYWAGTGIAWTAEMEQRVFGGPARELDASPFSFFSFSARLLKAVAFGLKKRSLLFFFSTKNAHRFCYDPKNLNMIKT